MRITVFGASGGTGSELVRQGLEAGHEVTAVVRDPAKLRITHERLIVHTAELTDPGALVPALTGRDAVLSGLGGQPPTAEQGTTVILYAMERAGVDRLVAVSAAPVAPPAEGEGLLFRRVADPLVRFVFRRVYADLANMEQALRGSSARWTSVRPPRLLDRPRTGRYRHAVGANLRGGRSISRADLACAMLEFVEDGTTVRKAVGVASAT